MTLNELRDRVTKTAVEHGFTDATIGEDVALFHSEASELLEDHREGRDPNEIWYEEKKQVETEYGTFTVSLKHSAPYPTIDDGLGMVYDTSKPYKPCGISSEAADLIIRVLHFCGKHNIDIDRAVELKAAYNNSRPFKHGKKL